jgi:hypothetical protein
VTLTSDLLGRDEHQPWRATARRIVERAKQVNLERSDTAEGL